MSPVAIEKGGLIVSKLSDDAEGSFPVDPEHYVNVKPNRQKQGGLIFSSVYRRPPYSMPYPDIYVTRSKGINSPKELGNGYIAYYFTEIAPKQEIFRRP